MYRPYDSYFRDARGLGKTAKPQCTAQEDRKTWCLIVDYRVSEATNESDYLRTPAGFARRKKINRPMLEKRTHIGRDHLTYGDGGAAEPIAHSCGGTFS